MQYDENGYPIKGTKDSATSKSTGPTEAGATEDAAFTSSQDQSAIHPNRREDSQPSRSIPRYDERGYPIKSQHQQKARSANHQRADGAHHSDSSSSSVDSIRPPNAHASMGTRNFDGNNSFNRVMAANANAQTNNGQLQQNYPQHDLEPMGGDSRGNIASQELFWSTGLCDVADDWDVFVEGVACICCEEGRLYNLLYNDQHNSVHCGACCASCTCYFFMAYVFSIPIVSLLNRRKMNEKYGIQGDGQCTSCCFACWCQRLSACQTHRQLHSHKVFPGGMCCAPSKDPDLCVIF